MNEDTNKLNIAKQLTAIPWYQSAVLRQQIVQLIVAATTLLGVTDLAGIDWDGTIAAIFAGIGALVALWTIVSRFFKPTPPVTLTKAGADTANNLIQTKLADTSTTDISSSISTLKK